MLMRRTISLWPAFVFRGDSRWNVLHFSKTNGTYLNQEYSVRVKSTTFRYICLFCWFLWTFQFTTAGRKLRHQRHAFPSICIFVREKHGSTRVKLRRPEKNQLPTWLRICSSHSTKLIIRRLQDCRRRWQFALIVVKAFTYCNDILAHLNYGTAYHGGRHLTACI